jgi:hypothetical protein
VRDLTGHRPSQRSQALAEVGQKQAAGSQWHTESLLLKSGHRHHKLWLVPVNAIKRPAMVIDNVAQPDTHSECLLVVIPWSQWPSVFRSLSEHET